MRYCGPDDRAGSVGAMNTLTLARTAARLAEIAHAAVDRPAEYADALAEAMRGMREALGE